AEIAKKNTEQAQEDLETQQAVEQAKADAVERASAEFQENPTHENADMVNHALTEQNNQSKVTEEQEKHLANQQDAEVRAVKESEAAAQDAESVKQENMKTVRQMAEERVAQKDQERADLKTQAQAQAEADAEAARQQKIEDSRSGKLEEESNRAKLIRLAEERGYTGEQAEQFVQDVMDFASDKKFNRFDQSKPLSASEGYLVMGALSRRFGVNVQITDTEGGVNGYYDPTSDTVVLNKNLPAGQILVEFALHEVTHSLEQSGKYKAYHDTVMDILYPSAAEREAAIAQKMAEYEDAGHPLLNDENSTAEQKAENEIVAEFTRLRLADRDVVRRMVDSGLGGTIRNTLHNINQFLKNKLKGNSKQTADVVQANEGKTIGQKQLTAEDLRRAERTFQKAIQERSRKIEKARRDAIKQANTPEGKVQRESKPVAVSDNGDAIVSEVGDGTYVRSDEDYEYSVASWTDEEKARVKSDLTKRLMSDGTMTQEEAEAKAQKYVDDVTSVAAIVLADRTRLDYEADPTKTMLKPNNEYYFTVDASTLCAKRLLYQGTFNAIQEQLPNTPLMPEDLIELANMMREMGYETPCGICYVESRRRWLGKFAHEWLQGYDGEYIPTIRELTTSDGLEELRTSHPEAYQSFVDEMNSKGSANPKVVQLRTDYRGDIMDMTEREVQKVKNIGGLRIQSFSDFEVPHLIDMMQAVADMASRGLTAQAYTKVPAFAWVFGSTGIKINLSLIGKGTGLDENGNLVFDDIEGMPSEEAFAIRERYSKNVGTILVGISDEHIIAAMGDSRIDFIIPFHKSGWSQEELRGMP
ncbi:MAG: hypothetical protein J6Y48_09230, partial [Clostridia bacterium]|nr:hypothetical protein [Clostridia bacterium]